MNYVLYNIVALPFLGVYLGGRLIRGKSREGWGERWGNLPNPCAPKTAPRLWVHAASVGEVVAATPILRVYKERHTDHEIVMSVITPGGHEVASNLIGSLVDAVFYCPFDMPAAVRRAVRKVQADVFVGLETELWPNLLYHVRRSGARAVLVNGRISDRSFPSYRQLRFLFGWTLSQFDRLLVQTQRDAERLLQIGATPAQIAIFGNAKFDQVTDPLDAAQIRALRCDLRLPEGSPVWVVGSTRTEEEERKVFAAYGLARQTLPDLVLIHAPRHIDRTGEVETLMRAAGLNPVRRTALATEQRAPSQLILDTFGELANVYALADVAFVGNSLVAPGGGQNLLQPLAQGKPVLYGPYTSNFRDICALVEEAGVGFRVANPEELARRVVGLVQDTSSRAERTARALALLEANRGVAARYAEAIADLMKTEKAS